MKINLNKTALVLACVTLLSIIFNNVLDSTLYITEINENRLFMNRLEEFNENLEKYNDTLTKLNDLLEENND